MNLYKKYKSALGYQTGENNIDSYGVDHSKFSLRDELEYQSARCEREKQIINEYNKHGISQNYPQYGTNFWGNATNNYGFGKANIYANINNRKDTYNNLNSSDNCHMTFDGKNLNLYNNGRQINQLDAQSGQDNYQSSEYQNIPNNGPLPEGTYYADQNQRQNISFKDAVIGSGVRMLNSLGSNMQRGNWKGGPVAWGLRRVWLRPDTNTQTYGRSGFTIHGGLSKGSAGCIDIPWQTGELSDYLDNCQDSVPLYVKYPKNW